MGAHTIQPRPPEVSASGKHGDEDARVILDSVRRIVRALRESSRAAEGRVGVSGAQLFVLQKLADAGALSLNELAERTLTHQSSVSVVVSRLEEAGFVRRARSAEDARRLEITLTRAGQALLAKAPGAAQELLIGGVRKLSPRERQQLARGLARLVDAMGIEERTPSMFFEDEPRRARRGHGHG